MSTSKKTKASIRQGGPGASHENAKAPLKIVKPPAESDLRRHSRISGGGGEKDVHHTHEPEMKGGGTRPAHPKPSKTPVNDVLENGISTGPSRLNQESDHNKHNDPGQSGHKPQKHSPSEEKD
jgi:hypothetical protein